VTRLRSLPLGPNSPNQDTPKIPTYYLNRGEVWNSDGAPGYQSIHWQGDLVMPLISGGNSGRGAYSQTLITTAREDNGTQKCP